MKFVYNISVNPHEEVAPPLSACYGLLVQLSVRLQIELEATINVDRGLGRKGKMIGAERP